MSNPFVPQGSLNRLLASVIFSDSPELNVTCPFLGKNAINVTFDGDANQLLGQLTGAVTSPEPYVFGMVSIHLVRSQSMAALYKERFERDTNMGSIAIIPDTITLPPFQFDTCVLQTLPEMTFDGNQADFTIKLKGLYRINSSAFFGA